LTAAFEIAGWNVTHENEATLDSLGSGIVVLPGGEISQEVRKVFEDTTKLRIKVGLGDAKLNGLEEGEMRLLIGTKPI
jgi:hypothetical protein